MTKSIRFGTKFDVGNEDRKEGFQRRLGFTTAILKGEGGRGS